LCQKYRISITGKLTAKNKDMGPLQNKFNQICYAWVVLLLVGSGASVSAQQEPQYTQYMFNTMSVNPGYAGTRNALNVVLLSRHQWAGLEGAPRTYDFSVHTPLNNYNMGLGFSMVADNFGPVNNIFLNISYAYRVKLSEKTTLSMGIRAGLFNYHVNLSGLNTDMSDPAFQKDLEQSFKPSAGAGLYLYSDNFYVGLSVPRLIETDLEGNQTTTGTVSELQRHFYFMTGVVFGRQSTFKFKPSFIARAVEGAPFSSEITGQLIFNETLWAGASYRFNQAIGLLTGLQISPQLMIGYSFDFPVSELKPFDSGTAWHTPVLCEFSSIFIKKKNSTIQKKVYWPSPITD
jgi:type IX secretion system PorP/SprF family membrane protein